MQKKPFQSEKREIGEILEVLEWARSNGAVMVKFDGVEVVWPPPVLESHDIVGNDYTSNEQSLAAWVDAPMAPGIRR